MPYTFLERWRIHRRAKRLLGIKKKDSEHFIFIQQCMEDLMDSGESDPGDARDICELLWSEQQDIFDNEE